MKKEYTKLIEQKMVDVMCDICGAMAKGRRCCICERDICNIHAHREYDRYGGDSSEKYCIDCWEVGKPFRYKMEELEQKYDSDIKKVEQDWKMEALNKKIKTNEGIELSN